MKKASLIVGLAFAAGTVLAAAWTNTWHYLPKAKFIPTSCVNVGTTGLSTGVSYIVFATTNIGNITEGQATTNGDFRQLIYALTDKFYSTYSAANETSRFAKATLDRSILQSSGSDMKKVYTIQFDLNLGSVTISGE